MEGENGILAVKKRGLRVIRAQVTPVSRLLGRTAADVDFRERYKAAIVAMQRGGKNIAQALSTIVFEAGDTLVLQASDDSPLLKLKPPTEDFYRKLAEEAAASTPKLPRKNSYTSLAKLVRIPNPLAKRPSQEHLESGGNVTTHTLPQEKAVQDDNGFFIAEDSQKDAEQGDGVEVSQEMVSCSEFPPVFMLCSLASFCV